MPLPRFHDKRFALAASLIEKKRIKSLSFDFFGGLFFRRAPKASDVLLHLGAMLAAQNKLGQGHTPESFAALRLRALEEILPKTLEALYAAMPQDALREAPAFYARQEELAEQAFAFVYEDSAALAALAIKKNIPLFLITDSLLPLTELRRLLKKKASTFPAPTLFLSVAKSGLKNKEELLEKAFGSFERSACLHIGPEHPLLLKADIKGPTDRRIDPLTDTEDFSAFMEQEIPLAWTERAPFFASSFGDGGLSFLRATAGFAAPQTASAEEQAFYLHGASVLSGVFIPYAAWAATRLRQKGLKAVFAPTEESRFLADLVKIFLPDLVVETKAPKKKQKLCCLALDETGLTPSLPVQVLTLFSTEGSFALQKKGGVIEGFLTQNKNPYELDEAWARGRLLIKAFCAEDSPFGPKALTAVKEGLADLAKRFVALNPSAASPIGSSLAPYARAVAQRILLAPTERERAWLHQGDASFNACAPVFTESLWPAEQARLRALCDQALKKDAKSRILDDKLWRKLFLQPTLPQRRFLNRYLAGRVQELGRGDLLPGLYSQLWQLGQRDFKTFKILWPLLRKERPDGKTWQFLKEAALAAEERKDIDYLVTAQNESHGMTYRGYYARDPVVPFQDPVLIRALETLLTPLRPALRPIKPLKKRPLRICLVMGGEAIKKYSPVSDTLFNTAEAFNRDRTEISFASVQFESVVRSAPDTEAWLKRLAPITRNIFYRQPGLPLGQAILRLAQDIAQEGFDALLFSSPTNARLALAALRPAPVLASFGFGWPELYTSPFLDFTTQWTDYPSLGCLCSSFRVPDSMPKDRFHIPAKPLSRSAIQVPKNAVIVLSSGRPIKYHEPFYWRIITAILERRPKTHFVFVGPTYEAMRDWLRPHIKEDHLSHLHFLGYRHDHAEVLACADIILDTIPAGGGFNLTEAMNLGLPTVLCRNKAEDFFAPYDNRFMLPTGEILQEPSLNFERDDFEGICAAVIRLIDSPKERKTLSKKMKETAALRKNAQKSADAIEALIRQHLAARLKGNA